MVSRQDNSSRSLSNHAYAPPTTAATSEAAANRSSIMACARVKTSPTRQLSSSYLSSWWS